MRTRTRKRKRIRNGADQTSSLPTDHRLLISVSGIPGSGKSLLAARIVRRVNALSLASSGANKSSGARIEEEGAEGSGPAIVVGMDGWHYSRAKLDTFEDPKRAHDRRGAAFTFDAEVSLCCAPEDELWFA